MCMICGMNQANAAAAEAAGATATAMSPRFMSSAPAELVLSGTLEGPREGLWGELRTAAGADDGAEPLAGDHGGALTTYGGEPRPNPGHLRGDQGSSGADVGVNAGSPNSDLIDQTWNDPGDWWDFSGNLDIDAVLIGSRWTSPTLTYSFPTTGDEYGESYFQQGWADNHIVFNPTQQGAAGAGFDLIELYTDLIITETTDPGADLRLSKTGDGSLPERLRLLPGGHGPFGRYLVRHDRPRLLRDPGSGELGLRHHAA